MTSLIHPSSSIGNSVQLGDNVKIGPYCNLDGKISIDDGTVLKSHVSITGNTSIGKYNIFFDLKFNIFFLGYFLVSRKHISSYHLDNLFLQIY